MKEKGFVCFGCNSIVSELRACCPEGNPESFVLLSDVVARDAKIRDEVIAVQDVLKKLDYSEASLSEYNLSWIKTIDRRLKSWKSLLEGSK